NDRKYDIVAGVPADKSTAGPGTDGFNIAKFKETGVGIAYDYGATLHDQMGNLAFDPDKTHPGFEFTIKNFSQLPGYDPPNGFGVSVYAGTPDDVVAGEDTIPYTHISPAAIPEPATWLGWSLATVGAVVGLRRARNRPRTPAAG